MTTEELAKRRAWAAIHFNQPNLTEAELDSGVFMPSENFSDGWDKGAEWALSSQWISVDERLPEKKKEVLLYDANSARHYVTGWRRMKGYNESQWALSNGFVEDKDITHWLPIPPLNPEKEER